MISRLDFLGLALFPGRRFHGKGVHAAAAIRNVAERAAAEEQMAGLTQKLAEAEAQLEGIVEPSGLL